MKHEENAETPANQVARRVAEVIEEIYGELIPFIVILPRRAQRRADMFTNILDVNELSQQLTSAREIIKEVRNAERYETRQ